tara:strand:- start:1491 stop:1721 length:231 start_codon:yes stop_codon:yes gene_type:complete
MKQLRFIFLLLLINCDKDDPLDESCLLVPDPGLCQAAFPRYYYNSETDKCIQFLWGGCGGVVPFETLEECKNACGS